MSDDWHVYPRCSRCRQYGHQLDECVFQPDDCEAVRSWASPIPLNELTCSYCGKRGHQLDQCWTLYPVLRPVRTRKRRGNRRSERTPKRSRIEPHGQADPISARDASPNCETPKPSKAPASSLPNTAVPRPVPQPSLSPKMKTKDPSRSSDAVVPKPNTKGSSRTSDEGNPDTNAEDQSRISTKVAANPTATPQGPNAVSTHGFASPSSELKPAIRIFDSNNTDHVFHTEVDSTGVCLKFRSISACRGSHEFGIGALSRLSFEELRLQRYSWLDTIASSSGETGQFSGRSLDPLIPIKAHAAVDSPSSSEAARGSTKCPSSTSTSASTKNASLKNAPEQDAKDAATDESSARASNTVPQAAAPVAIAGTSAQRKTPGAVNTPDIVRVASFPSLGSESGMEETGSTALVLVSAQNISTEPCKHEQSRKNAAYEDSSKNLMAIVLIARKVEKEAARIADETTCRIRHMFQAGRGSANAFDIDEKTEPLMEIVVNAACASKYAADVAREARSRARDLLLVQR